MFNKDDINTFGYQHLHGKTLRMFVAEEYDSLYNEVTTVVTGYEEGTGMYYVIVTDTKKRVEQ